MAAYQDIFVVTNVAKVHEQYLTCIDLASREDQLRRSRGLPEVNAATIQQLKQAHQQFQTRLRDIARVTSLDARQQIVDRIRRTKVRPDTGVSPHLQDSILCRALGDRSGFETGAVGIADEGQLNLTPYWKVQEEGTGVNGIRSIVGNVLRGYFYGTGYSGQPSGPGMAPSRTHPLFKPGPPTTGQTNLKSPKGVVHNEIQGRHFIRDGAALAAGRWRAQLDALQDQQVQVLGRMLGQP